MNFAKMLIPSTRMPIHVYSELNVTYDLQSGREVEEVRITRVENPFGDVLSSEEVGPEDIEILEEELTWRHNQPLDPTEDQ